MSPRILSGSPYSSLAQSVEHAAVNRRVVGSSPTVGAKRKTTQSGGFSFGIYYIWLKSAILCFGRRIAAVNCNADKRVRWTIKRGGVGATVEQRAALQASACSGTARDRVVGRLTPNE